MSWNFSPVLVAAFLEECCSDTAQSVQSNTTPTPDQYYWPDKPTEHSRLSRFGTTCVRFEGNRGEELLTWYLAGFLAKTSALPEPEPALTEREADSGARWPGSLAKYDPDTCSWKTAQRSLLGDSEPSLVTWPRSGLMLNGQCWELPTLERRTDARESGYWPTPNAMLGTSSLNFRCMGFIVTGNCIGCRDIIAYRGGRRYGHMVCQRSDLFCAAYLHHLVQNFLFRYLSAGK